MTQARAVDRLGKAVRRDRHFPIGDRNRTDARVAAQFDAGSAAALGERAIERDAIHDGGVDPVGIDENG